MQKQFKKIKKLSDKLNKEVKQHKMTELLKQYKQENNIRKYNEINQQIEIVKSVNKVVDSLDKNKNKETLTQNECLSVKKGIELWNYENEKYAKKYDKTKIIYNKNKRYVQDLRQYLKDICNS